MSLSFDSVTSAAKLRRDTIQVQQELEEKRADYQKRTDIITNQKLQLHKDRVKLQDTLVQYYKYIQDNEFKRSRANKRAIIEEKAKHERFGKIIELREKMDQLIKEKEQSRRCYQKYLKYQKYLEDVLQHNDNDEYQDPKDIIKRYEILDDNTKVLQRRKNQLEEDLGKMKLQLLAKRAKKKNESVDLQNKLSELQNHLEYTQKELRQKQDELEKELRQKQDELEK
eukprot:Tbor_TRINITY_DN538_c0_g1::TRINITY_DN538_c0_g1_i2::g.23338::m.23338